jgi:hypothetical protein
LKYATHAIIDMDEIAHLGPAAPNQKFGLALVGDRALADAGKRIGVVLILTIAGKRPIRDRFETMPLVGKPAEVLGGELAQP